jgi:hypothetical protein
MSSAQPEYLAYDAKQREVFLSQLGTFSPAERDVFHKLCTNWQPRIPYDRFVAIINKNDLAQSADVVSLLQKLKRQRTGLLRTEYVDGERVRAYVVITSQHAPAFYRELVEEYFVDMIESITNPFPFLSTIRREYENIPPGVFKTVTAEDLSAHFSGESTSDRAFAIPVLDGEQVLVPADKLKMFLNLAILKMRHHLSSTSLLSILAKLLDSSLLSLKEKIAAKDPSFWLQFCTTVVEKRNDLSANRSISVSPLFFHAAYIAKTLVEAQLDDLARRKRVEHEYVLDLEAIALAIKEAPDGTVDKAQLERMIEAQKDKYGESFSKFRDAFLNTFLTSHARNTLPIVVQLGERFVHRDTIFPMFLEHFRVVEPELKTEFIQRMEQSLRSNTRRTDSAFLSVDNFEDAISLAIRPRSEFLSSLIKKPVTLAEAMILHAKQNKLVHDVAELRERLSLYFDPDTLKPLPLREWFGLRLTEIFEYAFNRLPIWRRIWIRLTGKYDSLRAKYIGTSATSRRPASRPVAESNERDAERAVAEPRRRANHKSGKNRPQTIQRRSRRSARPEGEAQKRPYSKKQIDSAWETFGDAVRKGPPKGG